MMQDDGIDPGLAPACAAALAEHHRPAGHRVCTANTLSRFWADEPMDQAERMEPVLLRGFFSTAQIRSLLAAAEAPGVWPSHAKTRHPPSLTHRLASCLDGPAATAVSEVLEPIVQHRSFSSEHVVLYMHRDEWFQGALPVLFAHALDAMQTRSSGMLSGDALALRVRCIELHHYAPGGSLLTALHRDNGSALTMSVLLSDPARSAGGVFNTYMDGLPITHPMGQGDAILFASEKLHNVSTVTSGVRQALVVELWSGPTNRRDRFS